MGPAHEEVVGPDIVRALGLHMDAVPIIQPEPPRLRSLLWTVQPLPPPDPLDLVGLEPTELLAPPIVGEVRHAN